MGVENLTFENNATPQCGETWLNSVTSEVNNVITSTGQTLAVENSNQLSIATSIYAAGGDFYTDSGTADDYILSVIGSKVAPSAYFTGMRVRFVVGNTNTGAATANIATLGDKGIKARDGSSDPAAGELIAGQIVDLTYDGTNLVITAGVAYSTSVIPTGTMLDFAGTSAPSGYLLCYGQAVSRTTYANLFSTVGTAFGVGDGSTTFNLPDCRGRVKVGLDNLGGTSADRITSANADSLNNTGFGSETDAGTSPTSGATTLTESQIPAHTHFIANTDSPGGAGGGLADDEQLSVTGATGDSSYALSGTSTAATVGLTSESGGGGSHTHTGGALSMTTGSNAQPSIAVGSIIKT